MFSLADNPVVIGFFSYSRDDDRDSNGALSELRIAIQRELRSQLGRSRNTMRIWQDQEAIVAGRLWESEIRSAIAQSVFFIPIITPSVVNSQFCRTEFELFLTRELEISRSDLVFPILYIRVRELEDERRWREHPVLSIIGTRQYVDWRIFRHLPLSDANVRLAIERFCGAIADALTAPSDRSPHHEAEALADPARASSGGVRAGAAAVEDPLAFMQAELTQVSQHGLSGQHHYYIVFETTRSGIQLPADLRQRYPTEMTIVLQHRFWDLQVENEGFSVTLSFDSAKKRIFVPFAAVRVFQDPSIGLLLDLSNDASGREH